MRNTIMMMSLVLLGGVACDAAPAKTEKQAEKKAEAKAKTEAKATTVVKAEAKAGADTKLEAAPAAKPDADAKVEPEAKVPSRPKDVPADWQPVVGDVWSFWAPKDWKVSDYKPGDGGAGNTGDKQAEAQRSEGGMEVSSLSCWVRSDQGLPTALADLRKAVETQAKAGAKGHAATLTDVKVEHDTGPQDAVHVEYVATGDGTIVVERWSVSTRALGLVCSDQSGKKDAADRKILDTAIGSLRWTPGA